MRSRLPLVLSTFVCALLVLGCRVAPPESVGGERVLTVFAAASLKDALEALEPTFEAANPGVDVVLNLGGSQQLAQQVANGAPADLFAAANLRQMDVAVAAGRVLTTAVQTFAGNRLVVVTPAENPAALSELADLARSGIKLVLASESVPAGAYTLEMLANAAAAPGFAPDFDTAVVSNVVSYEENVRSVLNKVLLGEADAGIVYASDVTPDVVEHVRTIAIPAEINVVARYPVAPIADAPSPDAAQAFIDLLLSEDGQAALEAFGFLPAAQVP
jgi:molybdate transport system substrate-binding protein